MCQEGSMFVFQAKTNWCSTYVDKIGTKLTLNHQWRPAIPQSVFSKNTAIAFCRLLGDEQKMMKISEREYVKQLQQNWKHFFGADTSREISKFSFLPREITCTWLVSVVFIKAVAPKASEPPIRKKNKKNNSSQKIQRKSTGVLSLGWNNRLPRLMPHNIKATEGGLCTSRWRKKATWGTGSRKFNLTVIWCTHFTVCELN